jgi:A/G-specific adenine glycosylase
MLQQTQVSTVIPYFERFIERFSDVHSLAAANIDEVLFLWSGLGYYSRARNLHRTARRIVADFNGIFPDNSEALQTLPGIGRSTAGAIMAFAFNHRAAILDGNVKRVLARYFCINEPINLASTEKRLWELSEQCLPARKKDIGAYTQGMMDLGAMICTRNQPKCSLCPLKSSCLSLRANKQHELPVRQKQKVKPIRSSDFILIELQQRILLKQRPAKGVWGGLWCFPEQCELDELTPTPIFAIGPKWLEFRHTFSHFYLDCHIYQATFEHLISLPKGWTWYNREYPMAIGLPSPIKKTINQWLDAQLEFAQVAEFSGDYQGR